MSLGMHKPRGYSGVLSSSAIGQALGVLITKYVVKISSDDEQTNDSDCVAFELGSTGFL